MKMKGLILCCFLVALKCSSPVMVNGQYQDRSGTVNSQSSSGQGDEDIEYEHTIFNPNLPLGSFPEFEDFDGSETTLSSAPSSLSSSSSSSSKTPLITTVSSSSTSSNSSSPGDVTISESNVENFIPQASESMNIPAIPSGVMNKISLQSTNPLLANLTNEQKSVIVGDAFKRFVQTSHNLNKEQKTEEIDRLSALKSYLSHLKKEEMEKFKFPTSINSDWIPLISTKSDSTQIQQHLSNEKQTQIMNKNQNNDVIEKSGRLLESSNESQTTLKTADNIHQKALDDAKKVAEIYHDNSNELLDDKSEQNLYDNHNNNFKKYLTCCDKLFNQFGTVDEKIYEDMYISPAKYRFNPLPEVSQQQIGIKSPTPISTSYYSYPLRQPINSHNPSIPPMYQTYTLRPVVRDHIQTTVHMNTIPEPISPPSVTNNYDRSTECFADPHHFYHSHKRLPTRYLTANSNTFSHPSNFHHRTSFFRPPVISRQSWFARKKNSIFGRKLYFG